MSESSASDPRADEADDARDGAVDPAGRPAGEVYDWYRRAEALLANGDAAAAVPLLERSLAVEPDARSVREMLARAFFDSGRFGAAEDAFSDLIDRDPTDHYALFGQGLARSRQGHQERALEPLALAVAMRPDLTHYADALQQARATVNARREAREITVVDLTAKDAALNDAAPNDSAAEAPGASGSTGESGTASTDRTTPE
jgi:tetratricopeptide (TPR) repeat protein